MRIALTILLLMAPIVQGANEIRAFCPGVSNAYALVREIDGDVWYVSGQVFEVWGTGGRDAADYDIAMVDKSGDMFVGTFDTNISAGTYYVTTSSRVGAAPDDTDPVMWYDYMQWDGSAMLEPTPGGIADAVWDEPVADHTTETSFGGEVGGLDPNITLIKSVTDDMQIVVTTVSAADDANSFTLTAGIDVNEAYEGAIITVWDADDDHAESRMLYSWTSTRVVVVDDPYGFTPAIGDIVVIWYNMFPMNVYNRVRQPRDTKLIIIDRTVDPVTIDQR